MYKKIIITMVLAISIFTQVYAQDVKVGLYIINLGKFDISSGAFTADFYLSLKTDEEPVVPLDTFEFMNGRAASIDKITDLPNEKLYRIQANLNSQIDFKNFPFDKQKMQILIENKKYTIDQVRYVPDDSKTGLDKLITFSGWKLEGVQTISDQHFYPVYNENYSLYSFNISIGKIIWNAFFKTFMPVLITMFLIACSFLMDPDKVKDRLGISTTGLIASVMFHLSITNQIPPMSYLTVADKFMIVSYLILLGSVVINITFLQLLELKHTEIVEKIHRKMEYGMFFVIGGIYVLFFTFTFMTMKF